MQTDNNITHPTPIKRWYLVRGESLIASSGIAFAVLVLSTLFFAGWWTVDHQRESHLIEKKNQLTQLGHLLVPALSNPLSQNQIEKTHTLLRETAKAYNLMTCRIELADGQIIADADGFSKTNNKSIPLKFPLGLSLESRIANDDHRLEESFAIPVKNRGTAKLLIESSVIWPQSQAYEMQVGLAGIGAVSLLVVLLVYRGIRRKLRGVSAIRDSLMLFASGERDKALLQVPPTLGGDASAWNELLEEREKLSHRSEDEQLKLSAGDRRGSRVNLANACDSISAGLVLLDHSMSIKYINGAGGIFLRQNRDQLVGSAFSDFIDDPDLLESLEGVIQGTTTSRKNFEIKKQQGHTETILKFNLRPVRKDDAAAAMIVIEDITQQKIAEEARNSFVAQATHELRTPLTNIRLYVEQAMDEGEDDPQLRTQCINVINQEARRLERIVSDMLSVAQMESGSIQLHKDDVRLDVILKLLQEEYQPQAASKKIDFSFDLPPKLSVIQGDRDKITIAMHNLIGNAIKYTPKGGRVSVAITEDDEIFHFDVTDTGIGISEEDTKMVFEKFYRANDKRITKITGTGLGLAIAREMIRLHGGDITIKSEIDKGSTFSLSLPIEKKSAA